MDYIIEVNSELDYIYRAFSMVAHLFSKDSDYMGLLAIFSAAAIFFTAIFTTIKTGMGKADIKMWIMYVAGTWAVMLLITGKKVEVTIHDLTLNEVKSIGGVPEVMAFIGTLENKIERTIVEMIETVMTPLIPYDAIGKGDGFQLLANTNTMATNYLNDNIHVKKSISSYYNKCVIPDLSLGFESPDIIHNSPDIWTSIKSETRSRSTIVYTADDAQGRAYPCAEAYDEISKELSIAAITKVITDECEMSTGIKNDSCSQNLNHIVKGGIAPNSDVNKYLRSYIVSYIIMSNEGMIESALADVNKKNMSQGILAESQLPRLKSVVFGLMIGIFPLLVLFLFFNPVKAITFYLGLFMMMILWGSLDAFMDMQYQNEVMNMFAVMRRPGNELGVHQMFDVSSKAADAVSLYGSSRWLMLGLATAISSAITGINSYAMSQFGSQLGSTAQQAAGSRADSLGTSGDMRLKEQAGEELGLRMRANEFTVANQGSGIASRAYQNSETSIGNANAMKNAMGSDQAVVGANVLANTTNTLSNYGATTATASQASALGLTTEQFGGFQRSGNVLDAETASGLNSKFGVDTFKSGQTLAYGYADGELQNMKLSSDDGIHMTQALDNQGNVHSTTLQGEKDGTAYTNFTTFANGMITGSKTSEENGIAHTQSYNGSTMSDSYSNGAGQAIRQDHALQNGSWVETNYSQGKNINIGNNSSMGDSFNAGNAAIEAVKEGNYGQLAGVVFGSKGANGEVTNVTDSGNTALMQISRSLILNESVTQASNFNAGAGGTASAGGHIPLTETGFVMNANVSTSLSAGNNKTIDETTGMLQQSASLLANTQGLTNGQREEILFGQIKDMQDRGESMVGANTGTLFMDGVKDRIGETMNSVKGVGGIIKDSVFDN